MSRCVSCNRILTVFELHLDKKDGVPEDLCSSCKRWVTDALFMHDISDLERSADVIDILGDDDGSS